MVSCTRSVKPARITREVLIKQRDKVLERIGAYTFTFKFERELVEDRRFNQPEYPEYQEQHKRLARFSQFMKVTNISPAFRATRYAVQVKISPFQALGVLEGNSVRVKWGISNKWPRRAPEGSDTPPFGIGFYTHFSGPSPFPPEEKPSDLLEDVSGGTKGQDKVRDILMKRHLASAEILVSSEYQVKDNYLPGEEENPEDFRWLRIGIWHEIIELAIIYMATEGFCFPYWMYHNLLDTEKRGEGAKNFAHNAVCEVQASLENERSLWLYWDDDDEDPPFDAFEVGAYTREAEARRLEDDAIRLEGQGNWAGAREKWIEAEDAWEIAIRAWEAVPRHPDREQRIKAARDRLTQVREKRLIAQWEGASWNVTSTSAGEINIRYSAWPVRFQAKIADVKGHVLAAFDKPSGTGVIIWGKGEKAGLYFIRVEAERIEPMVRKIVIF